MKKSFKLAAILAALAMGASMMMAGCGSGGESSAPASDNGGTTAAALYELEGPLVEGTYAAVAAALARTRELAEG